MSDYERETQDQLMTFIFAIFTLILIGVIINCCKH